MRLSLKERRMKLLNVTNLDGKSGIRGPKTMGEALRQPFVPDLTICSSRPKRSAEERSAVWRSFLGSVFRQSEAWWICSAPWGSQILPGKCPGKLSSPKEALSRIAFAFYPKHRGDQATLHQTVPLTESKLCLGRVMMSTTFNSVVRRVRRYQRTLRQTRM